MPTLDAATTVQFFVLDTAANAGKTGDVANLTLRRVINTTAYTIDGTPVEVDATNLPGVYAIPLTGAENSGALMSVGGKSSTADCVVLPTTWANEDIWAATTREITGGPAPIGTAMRGTDNAALAATALSNAVWTDAKAAYLDAAISSGAGLSTAGKAAVVTALLEGDLTAYEAAGATGVRLADMITAIRAVVVGKLLVTGTTAKYFEVDGTTICIQFLNVAADYSSHDAPTGA